MLREKEKESKSSPSSACCFIILKRSEYIKEESKAYEKREGRCFARQFMNNPFDKFFLDKLMRNGETYFTFAETLDAKKSSEKLPEISGSDPFKFLFNAFESRLSIKLNMSLDELKKELGSLFSEYQGKNFYNPSQAKKVEQKLHAALVGTHFDIKNERTTEWVRVFDLKLKPHSEPGADDGCRIA